MAEGEKKIKTVKEERRESHSLNQSQSLSKMSARITAGETLL